MSKVFRGFWGIVASLPLAYIVFFFIGWFFNLAVLFFVEGPFGYFYYYRVVLWRLFIMSILLGGGSSAVAITHVLVTNRLDLHAKGVWIFVLYLGNIAALPFYWYFVIWHEAPFHVAGAAQHMVDRERSHFVAQRELDR